MGRCAYLRFYAGRDGGRVWEGGDQVQCLHTPIVVLCTGVRPRNTIDATPLSPTRFSTYDASHRVL